jgi:GNAT superfamily N-acetyltransferase
MTRDEWVSDLWVRCDSRSTGIGGELLAHAEGEIRSRGHQTPRLRVVVARQNSDLLSNQADELIYPV